ncbi:MAG TPA: hypothetical protein VHS81_05330 [Caulobacteraceae bacterium]|nr:hypothetical protein [Caulobacteraceae bacterium]
MTRLGRLSSSARLLALATLALATLALAGPALAAPLTRADILSQKIASDTVVLSGYRAPGDLGAGAVYSSVGATPGGLEAVKDAAGTWFNLVLAGEVNVGWFGAYGDNGAHQITAADIAAHPEWRGTYTAGATWDTVAVNEALIAAFGGSSTPGHVAWNSLVGEPRRNETLFVPTANYGINRTLDLAAAFFTIEFASRAANWEWKGPADQPMLVTDSIAYADIRNIGLSSASPASYGEAAPLWVMDHSGANGGLSTQQITVTNATIRTSYNGRGVSISPSGGGAQGDTITFVNPLFTGARPDYCLRVGGANALSIMILDGDFQGCTHDAIQVAHGTVYVYGTSFQDQDMALDNAPVTNQLTTFGADLHVYAGEGPTAVNKFQDVRAEDETPVNCEPGAYCDVEDVESAGASLENFFPTYPYQAGNSVSNATTGYRTFMVVDDGGVAGWRPVGDGSHDCVIEDLDAHFTPGTLTGRRIFLRIEAGGTVHFTIAANTATSVTLAGGCPKGSPGHYLLYHVSGVSGAEPPDWTTARPGASTMVWGAGSGQGFTTSAGSPQVKVGSDIYSRIAVGDWVVIPGADRLGRKIVFPSALFGRVEARTGGDTLTLSRSAGAAVANAYGYWGAPLRSHDVSFIDLDFNAFSGAQQLMNASAAAGRTSRLGTVIDYTSPRADWRRSGEPPPPRGVYSQLAGPVGRVLAKRLDYAPAIDLTAALDSGDALMLQPTGDAVLNAPAPPPGLAREVTLQIETAGGAAHTITFGANFKSAGPLQLTATPDATYVVRFVSDGETWNEASRAGPNAASARR